MARPSITTITVVLMAAVALLIASPLGSRVSHGWVPAINFAIGTSLVLFSFIELGRAIVAWLKREAALGWIVGSAVAALGMFAAGAATIPSARGDALAWVVTVGLLVALAGFALQGRYRARDRNSA